VEGRGRGRLKKWLNGIECNKRTAGACECGRSSQVEVEDQDGQFQIAGRIR